MCLFCNNFLSDLLIFLVFYEDKLQSLKDIKLRGKIFCKNYPAVPKLLKYTTDAQMFVQ